MMKLKYLICNHKNKLTYNEVKRCISDLKNIDTSKVDFIVCPSLPYIYNFIEYKLGAQDVSAYEESLTGEVSARQLNSLKINNVIIGHTERKYLLKENNEIFINKIKMANKYNIRVIYCVTENEMFLDDAKEVIKQDLQIMKEYLRNNAIIAYEPKWAIGSDIELDITYINEVIKCIKDNVDNDVIYGGHVTDDNIEKLLEIEEIRGFLISNSSLDSNILQNIISKMS